MQMRVRRTTRRSVSSKLKLETEATEQRLAGDNIQHTSVAPKYSDVITENKLDGSSACSSGRTTNLKYMSPFRRQVGSDDVSLLPLANC